MKEIGSAEFTDEPRSEPGRNDAVVRTLTCESNPHTVTGRACPGTNSTLAHEALGRARMSHRGCPDFPQEFGYIGRVAGGVNLARAAGATA